jgi:hypothetical protein
MSTQIRVSIACHVFFESFKQANSFAKAVRRSRLSVSSVPPKSLKIEVGGAFGADSVPVFGKR